MSSQQQEPRAQQRNTQKRFSDDATGRSDNRIRQSCVQPLQPDQDNQQKMRMQQQPGQLKMRQSPSQQESRGGIPGDITPQDIDHVIQCVEREYGAKISDEVKQTMRKEISEAVPELTDALKPLIESAENGQYKSEDVQQKWIKSFMEVMLPHMQKIVHAAQLQQQRQQQQ